MTVFPLYWMMWHERPTSFPPPKHRNMSSSAGSTGSSSSGAIAASLRLVAIVASPGSERHCAMGAARGGRGWGGVVRNGQLRGLGVRWRLGDGGQSSITNMLLVMMRHGYYVGQPSRESSHAQVVVVVVVVVRCVSLFPIRRERWRTSPFQSSRLLELGHSIDLLQDSHDTAPTENAPASVQPTLPPSPAIRCDTDDAPSPRLWVRAPLRCPGLHSSRLLSPIAAPARLLTSPAAPSALAMAHQYGNQHGSQHGQQQPQPPPPPGQHHHSPYGPPAAPAGQYSSAYGNQFYNPGQRNNVAPIQTQNHAQMQGQRGAPYSPYSQPSPGGGMQSPSALSPTMAGMSAQKRQQLSPNAASPTYGTAYNAPYQNMHSPGVASPGPQPYMNHNMSGAAPQAAPSFNHPQPYQMPPNPNARPPPNSMPPPKQPASKMQDNTELEKASAKDYDVSNVSDVLWGTGVDLREEEEAMLETIGKRKDETSFNSQSSNTVSPNASFNWNLNSHGAYQGTGGLQQPMTVEQQQAELVRKHEQAARALAEVSQAPLQDPFLKAGVVRQKMMNRAAEFGVSVNIHGLFDKIPNAPANVTRTSFGDRVTGDSIDALEADSILNRDAPFVEVLSLICLAAEERVRTIIEDAFGLAQTRQNTADGIVDPAFADFVRLDGQTTSDVTVEPKNLSKSSWEAPDSAVSPLTTSNSELHHPKPAKNSLLNDIEANTARLPTPPSETPPTPKPTICISNKITASLGKRVSDDFDYETARLAKRQKRKAGNAATTADPVETVVPIIPEKMTKKERDRLNKLDQTEEVMQKKTAATALKFMGGIGGFGKKQYSWMMGGSGKSGAATPQSNAAATPAGTAASGTATPAEKDNQPKEKELQGLRRTFGMREDSEEGKGVQLRDLVQVMDADGKLKRLTTCVYGLGRPTIKKGDYATAAKTRAEAEGVAAKFGAVPGGARRP
ncbi:hypothetical protein P154DRAFT_610117 [Amniculicola lignicola CBS 123094]|uniref:Uncharacterized protein n=1 Tax=Amniculicola lignicola CBS 123094 TaxID=1392246 RepID=A0A6A5W437_9PLEO|nr:hypothetical protein P154DRAFT_610117 [Amniculicola lignicola CBS 123094]